MIRLVKGPSIWMRPGHGEFPSREKSLQVLADTILKAGPAVTSLDLLGWPFIHHARLVVTTIRMTIALTGLSP